MQRQNKSAKMLCVGLLSISGILLSCAGTQVPDAPAERLYAIDIPDKKLLCSETDTGGDCPSITLDQADKFFCLKPSGWKDLENYIDELIALIKSSGSGVRTESHRTVMVSDEDVQKIKDQLFFLRRSLEWKRKHLRP